MREIRAEDCYPFQVLLFDNMFLIPFISDMYGTYTIYFSICPIIIYMISDDLLRVRICYMKPLIFIVFLFRSDTLLLWI